MSEFAKEEIVSARFTDAGIEVTTRFVLPVDGDCAFADRVHKALNGDHLTQWITDLWFSCEGDLRELGRFVSDEATTFELTRFVVGSAVRTAVPDADTEWWWDDESLDTTCDALCDDYISREWLEIRHEWADQLRLIWSAVESKSLPAVQNAHASLVALVRTAHERDPLLFVCAEESL